MHTHIGSGSDPAVWQKVWRPTHATTAITVASTIAAIAAVSTTITFAGRGPLAGAVRADPLGVRPQPGRRLQGGPHDWREVDRPAHRGRAGQDRLRGLRRAHGQGVEARDRAGHLPRGQRRRAAHDRAGARRGGPPPSPLHAPTAARTTSTTTTTTRALPSRLHPPPPAPSPLPASKPPPPPVPGRTWSRRARAASPSSSSTRA